MWVAHISPGLIAKPFVPNVPLWVLSLAGALPDALHLIFAILTIESCHCNFDPQSRLAQLQKGCGSGCGCFPYSESNGYPFTHSLLGMAAAGLVYAGIYTALTDRRVTLRDQAAILFTVLSHFVLDILVQRKGLFAYPIALLILEMTILYTGFLVWHTASPPFARAGAMRDPWLPRALLVFFALEEAYFYFGLAPTLKSRYIHAPMFLGEIVLNSYLIARLD